MFVPVVSHVTTLIAAPFVWLCAVRHRFVVLSTIWPPGRFTFVTRKRYVCSTVRLPVIVVDPGSAVPEPLDSSSANRGVWLGDPAEHVTRSAALDRHVAVWFDGSDR